MITLILIFTCATVLLAIFYIRRTKIRLRNVEEAFKELSVLYYEEKQKNQVMLDEYWKWNKKIF